MKIALVHDWIGSMGGAERVLKELTRLWPQAPVYTLWTDAATVAEHFPTTDIRTSSLTRWPRIARWYPWLAPLMPAVIEQFDLSDFDTVISSSVTFSKGIVVRPDTRHLCYCYSPTRMLWDRAFSYERQGVVSNTMRHLMRLWDTSAAQRPDQYLAISQTSATRIKHYYRRDAIIVPPPTAMPDDLVDTPREDFFLVVGRLMPHKELDTVIEAFSRLKYPLTIVGSGPLEKHLRASATSNVHFTGHLADARLAELYRTCRAVIVPNEEDWGLTAVEAMAHGAPVLAVRKGGATETVIEGITGEFYDDVLAAALADGIRRIRQGHYDAMAIATHAQQWSTEHFATRMRTLVESN